MDNINDPTIEAILKYMEHSSIIAIKERCKGNDVFSFSKVDVTEIENETLKLNEKKSFTKL